MAGNSGAVQASINLAASSLFNTPFQFLVGPEGSGAPFSSIQAAIDAAGDRDIDNIANVIVFGGPYEEDVSVRRGVTINAFGGARIIGTLTIEFPADGTPTEDNVTALQNLLIEPPPGSPGIVFSGPAGQLAVMTNIQVSTEGADVLDISNADPSSALIMFGGQYVVDSGAGVCVSKTSPSFTFINASAFQKDSSTTTMDFADGFTVLNYCSVDGDVDVGAPAGAFWFASDIGTALQPAANVDGFMQMNQCGIQTDSTPAVTGTGLFAYSDLGWIGGGRDITGPTIFSTGQSYTPSGGAAPLWLPPVPTSLEDAVERLLTAVSTGAALGPGLGPI